MVIYCSGYVQLTNGHLFPIPHYAVIDSDFMISKSGDIVDLCDPYFWL